MWEVREGDCLALMREMTDNSVDAIVTDPPSGINFMNLEFDSDRGGRDSWIAWLQEIMAECLRVIKPGGHAVVWSLPRVSYWTATALDNAGWEIRDCIYHIQGQGFPKGLTISLQYEQELCERVETKPKRFEWCYRDTGEVMRRTPPFRSDAANKYWGFNVALKPAVECWWLCRRPLSEPNVASNVLRWNCGGLNIGACRVGVDQTVTQAKKGMYGAGSAQKMRDLGFRPYKVDNRDCEETINPPRRWPPNTVFEHDPGCVNVGVKRVKGDKRDGSITDTPARSWMNTSMAGIARQGHADPDGKETVDEYICVEGCVVAELDRQSGISHSPAPYIQRTTVNGNVYELGSLNNKTGKLSTHHGDSGGASRFFPTFSGEYECVDGCPVRELSEQSGTRKSGMMKAGQQRVKSKGKGGYHDDFPDSASVDGTYGDEGTAARYFPQFQPDVEVPFLYCAKASTRERSLGCENLPAKKAGVGDDRPSGDFQERHNKPPVQPRGNNHPTTKPLSLMRWLCKLVTPPGGVILDPFGGSGTTGCAAVSEGFDCILCEREPDYVQIARARISYWEKEAEKNREKEQPTLFELDRAESA